MTINLRARMATIVLLALFASNIRAEDMTGTEPAAVPNRARGLLSGWGQSSVRQTLADTTGDPLSADSESEATGEVEPAAFQSYSYDQPAEYVDATPMLHDGQVQCSTICVEPIWLHRSGVFAELLILRPGNVDVIYAQEVTGPTPADSPTGPLGRLAMEAQEGYRLGFDHAMSECSSLRFGYTWFDSDEQDTITANAPNVLALTVGDPSLTNVGATSVTSSAEYHIAFQLAELDYRTLLYGTCDTALNFSLGFRYAHLDQNLTAEQDVGAPTGLTTVDTEIDFDGFGIGFGLDGMRRSAYSGLLVYGKASASFVSGEFQADFLQTNQFGGGVAATDFEDFRTMTILQSELGLGWQSQSGNVRLTAGYQAAGWFNALTTGTFIGGVQDRDFTDLYETISFNGLVTRAEVRF